MKRYFKVLLLSFVCLLGIAATRQSVFAEEVDFNDTNFPDATLREELERYYAKWVEYEDPEDEDNSYSKYVVETNDVTSLKLGNYYDVETISNLKGLELFTNLTSLEISGYSGTSIDLSPFTKLTSLEINSSNISTIDLTSLPSVSSINCYANSKLTSVKLGSGVTYARINSSSTLTSLNVSAAKNLSKIELIGLKIKSFDGSALSKLSDIYVWDCPALTTIKTGSAVTDLTTYVADALSSLQIAAPAKMQNLHIDNSKISSLNLSKMTNLQSLYLGGTKLKSINVSGLKKLTSLSVSNNKTITSVKTGPSLSALTLENAKALTSFSVVSPKKLTSLWVCGTKLKKIDVSKFVNLTSLTVSNNSYITKVDTSKLSKLLSLTLNGNKKLKSIDIKKNTKLNGLTLAESVLTTVDTSKNTKLTSIEVYNSKISKLNLKKNTALGYIDASGSKLSSIDLTKNKKLYGASFSNCSKLKSLSLTKNTKLRWITLSSSMLNKVKLPSGTTPSITIYAKKGSTLNLSSLIGTGYTMYADKSYLLTYNKKKGTLTTSKKYKYSYAGATLKKGKKVYNIDICFD